MRLEYSEEYLEVMVLAVFLVIVIYYVSRSRTRERLLLFGNFETLEKASGHKIKLIGWMMSVIRIIAVILIISAFANPRLIETKSTPLNDFVLAVDTSSSMLTPDYNPNRLEAVKDTVTDWVSSVQNIRSGLVSFAGKPYVRLEMTTNKELILSNIKALTPDYPAGTAIGEALISSTALLKKSTRNRTIILITDGRSNFGVEVNKTIPSLQKNRISVIAIGIGKPRSEGSQMVVPAELIGKNATEAEYPELDVDVLKMLANATNGDYYFVDNVKSLEQVLGYSTGTTEIVTEPAKYLMLTGVLFLLIEWVTESTKYRPLP